MAIVLDLMQPAVTGGRLLHQGGDQGLDEGKEKAGGLEQWRRQLCVGRA